MTEKRFEALAPILTDEDAEAAMDDDLGTANLADFRPWSEFARRRGLNESNLGARRRELGQPCILSQNVIQSNLAAQLGQPGES